MAVRGIERNRAVVTPGRAAVLARAARWFPSVAERQIASAMRRELERSGAGRG